MAFCTTSSVCSCRLTVGNVRSIRWAITFILSAAQPNTSSRAKASPAASRSSAALILVFGPSLSSMMRLVNGLTSGRQANAGVPSRTHGARLARREATAPLSKDSPPRRSLRQPARNFLLFSELLRCLALRSRHCRLTIQPPKGTPSRTSNHDPFIPRPSRARLRPQRLPGRLAVVLCPARRDLWAGFVGRSASRRPPRVCRADRHGSPG